jgi:hypothetical protein
MKGLPPTMRSVLFISLPGKGIISRVGGECKEYGVMIKSL